MNRLGTAVLAAVEAVVSVGVVLGIALVPLTLLWGFEYGLQVDWSVFWQAAGSVWMIGHGVDVSYTLSAAAAKASDVSGAGAPIAVTLPALGFALLTAWLGARAGRRFAETEHRVTGTLVGTALVAVFGLLIGLSSTSSAIHPTLWQAIVLPALWFGVPAAAQAEVCRRRRGAPADALTQRVIDLTGRIPDAWRAVVAHGLRAGTAAIAVVVAVAGTVVGFLVLASFAEVITLYERSHAGIVGGLALTVGQLAFLPDFVGWAFSWIIGPGFALGSGSGVSPIGTTLGPIPGIPVFGALPASGHTFGLVWVLVPVVTGFVVGGLLRPRLVRALGSADTAAMRAAGGAATGVVAGILAGLVAWATTGSSGPGRLAVVGPEPWSVALVAALEVGVPAVIALAIGTDLVRLPERTAWTTEEHWQDDGAEPLIAEEGSLLDALDRAGAGRTTDVHRFAVREQHGRPVGHDAPTRTATDPEGTSEPTGSGPSDATRTTDATGATDAAGTGRGAGAARRSAPAARDRSGDRARRAATRTDPADQPTEPVGAPGALPLDHGHRDEDVTLPDWARAADGPAGTGPADTGSAGTAGQGTVAGPRDAHDPVVAARGAVRPAASPAGPDDQRAADDGRDPGLQAGARVSIRERLRQAARSARGQADEVLHRAAEVRARAEELRERVTGADAERPARPRTEQPADREPRTDEQPAFPWSTEEFVAGRDDADTDERGAAGERPDGRPAWDVTDQIPEHELPWWKRGQR